MQQMILESDIGLHLGAEMAFVGGGNGGADRRLDIERAEAFAGADGGDDRKGVVGGFLNADGRLNLYPG